MYITCIYIMYIHVQYIYTYIIYIYITFYRFKLSSDNKLINHQLTTNYYFQIMLKSFPKNLQLSYFQPKGSLPFKIALKIAVFKKKDIKPPELRTNLQKPILS
eukprot:EC095765.1.p2 GENE.EC095765.1~~EC095765.1.p2  ORF type:complete len:103 (-),score=6.09 EC095765.1:229-537(-)